MSGLCCVTRCSDTAACAPKLVDATGSYDLPVQGVAAAVLIASGLFALVDCTRGYAPGASLAVAPERS